MAKQATWVGAFIAITTLVVAIAIIGYQEYKGCSVKSLGAIVRAEFYDCPTTQPVAEQSDKPGAPGNFFWDYENYLISCDIPILKVPDASDTLGAAELTMLKMATSIVPYATWGVYTNAA